MKELFIKYKSVIKFILTFLLVYIILSILYKLYLQYSNGVKFYPDYVTHMVSKQVEALLNIIGYRAEVLPHPDEPSIKVIVNNRYLVRVIEGCNAFSVIILFISFILAFSGKARATLIYLILGSILIYIGNVLRIVVLTMGMYHYPKYESILHNVVFPIVIYGMVFFLWFFWVNRFSKLNKKNA
ncbi:exosortase family protein XrtF [Flavivirga aquatica]|uniref:Exosortase family protein XrtF n=1 Tax=Flavivirga aquatica TaxID=1849968 RepID=A0A1E5SJJ8_9FLAO|nr:exosortase family protein XrtF [Flavivirga aquatica]OEJ99236.1 exosortase family protein XrtF [Flavivirga aquatica]